MAKQYKDYRIIMLLDKAGWHTSKLLALPPNIKLLHLTPYSPELNPVELLWREIRAKYFHNWFFKSLDEVENTLTTALVYYQTDDDAIKSLSYGYKYFNNIGAGYL